MLKIFLVIAALATSGNTFSSENNSTLNNNSAGQRVVNSEKQSCTFNGYLPSVERLRPTPKYRCSYDINVLADRISKFFTPSPKILELEKVSDLFSIHGLVSDYDSERVATYSAVLEGEGGWRMQLSVSEGFYPSDKGPPKFIPGPQPKRLDKFENSKRDVSLRISNESMSNIQEKCRNIGIYLNLIKANGWKNVKFLYAPDGGRSMSSMTWKGIMSFSMTPARGKYCEEDIFFSERPRQNHTP
jgi:hypothetical protein